MTAFQDQVIGLYERHARQWDSDRLRILFERDWLDRFAALLPADGPILDLGCGSAEPLARYFIERGFQICGVDSSPTLISLCRGRFPQQEWHVADMRALSLARQFHGIIAWDSFFHLNHADQRRMFPIFETHAAPGAVLMFTSGPSFSESIGSYQGEPLFHASLDGEEYRSLLLDHGFDVVRQVNNDPCCDRHTVWLAQHKK